MSASTTRFQPPSLPAPKSASKLAISHQAKAMMSLSAQVPEKSAPSKTSPLQLSQAESPSRQPLQSVSSNPNSQSRKPVRNVPTPSSTSASRSSSATLATPI